jgi:hypothetical protein
MTRFWKSDLGRQRTGRICTMVPDGSKWRWNVEDQDCYYGTIALEVFDSCDSDSTTTTILVDNVAPDFWLTPRSKSVQKKPA